MRAEFGVVRLELFVLDVQFTEFDVAGLLCTDPQEIAS
jgi:hypothetical protein